MEQEKVDYRNEHFIVPIETHDTITYASVNAQMYGEEDGLGNTGSYFIYLLHPTMGSTHFIIEPTSAESKPWAKQGAPKWLEKEIVDKIIAKIEERKKQLHDQR